MKRKWIAVLLGMVLVAGLILAQTQSYTFEFSEEVKKAEQRQGFNNRVMIKTPTFSVSAFAVKDEIKLHRHPDGDHVLYIVSGRGTLVHGEMTIPLKGGIVVHIPKGITHSIKAGGEELTFVDFAQPPFDPGKTEWVNR
ncbi:cupin domain-containing protein [Calidithermus roseus]|uniref:Mannose-6-phosphate isomerase, class I n=1 Tax=Calidithermus roseus TaxID=1644118 RepID=A0A399F3Z7_9DEIN|nr:cupin domain-containing protein [Calidithermus roseus]RIH89592.1 mannose-6-phosphate isomerase, class I [Calidithermus roseus]